MKISRCACVCMWVRVLMHEDVPRVCMVWLWGTNWTKYVKHTQDDQNMIHMIKQNQHQRLELSWVQNNTELSLRQSVKHMTCNNAQQLWKMHEHMEKCLNTWSNCHEGSIQIQKQQMGHSPIKDFEKYSIEKKIQPNFRKSPIFKTLSINSA